MAFLRCQSSCPIGSIAWYLSSMFIVIISNLHNSLQPWRWLLSMFYRWGSMSHRETKVTCPRQHRESGYGPKPSWLQRLEPHLGSYAPSHQWVGSFCTSRGHHHQERQTYKIYASQEIVGNLCKALMVSWHPNSVPWVPGPSCTQCDCHVEVSLWNQASLRLR